MCKYLLGIVKDKQVTIILLSHQPQENQAFKSQPEKNLIPILNSADVILMSLLSSPCSVSAIF